MNIIVHKWQDEPATKNQIEYIRHIWNECDIPLQPFVGKTKGEAAEWISKNRHWAYHSQKTPEERRTENET